MTPTTFDKLLSFVQPSLLKETTQLRQPLSPALRLSVGLSFLATGDSFRLIAMFYRIGISTCREVVYEVCAAIIECCASYLVTPRTSEEWLNIAKG